MQKPGTFFNMRTMETNNASLLDGSSFKSYGLTADPSADTSPSRSQVNFQPRGRFGSRHVFALLGFLGLATAYMMRVNLSVTIVDMVRAIGPKRLRYNSSSADSGDQCPTNDVADSDSQDGEFDWDSHQQGLVLGSFFWGYMLSQIPGGLLAEKFGGKCVFGLGTLFTALFSLLSPVAARTGLGLFIAARVATGLAEGVTLPSMHVLLSRWVPPSERSTMGAFIWAGMQFGTVIAYPLSGFLCQIPLDNGWPLAFYVPGIAGILWFMAWSFLVSDGPDVHPGIDEGEKQFIMVSCGAYCPKKSISSIPWRSMLTSIHLWAIVVAHVGQAWGFYMLLTELPTYMKTVLHFDLKSNSWLSALPYLAMWILSNVTSIAADALRKRNVLNTTKTRKLFNSIGFILPACALIATSYSGCDRRLTVALITIASGTNGAVYSGFQVNHIDLAPNFAGVAMGFTNCVANICGFLAPYFVGVLVTTEGSLNQWRTVFFVSAIAYISTNFFYVTFATGDEQPWNQLPNGKQDVALITYSTSEVVLQYSETKR